MCNFFSLVSDGSGRIYYFDWDIRKRILSKELNYESADSHTSIADYYGFKGSKEDELNKYEYNPFTKEFKTDQLNTTDDSESVKTQCLDLDWSKIVPQLIIKPIINPLQLPKVKVTKKDIENLKKWIKTYNNIVVESSVWSAVWSAVGSAVESSVW
jgi:hypothetical protein